MELTQEQLQEAQRILQSQKGKKRWEKHSLEARKEEMRKVREHKKQNNS